jgi:hypothetical protein
VTPNSGGEEDRRHGVLGGVSARGWRRAGCEASVGCGGARETSGCGCGAAELANGGEQRVQRRSGGGAEQRRSRGSKMRPRERVKVVEEGCWSCCGTKMGHGRAEVAAGDWQCDVAASGYGSTTWRGGQKLAGFGRAAAG